MAVADRIWGRSERVQSDARLRLSTLPWVDLAVGAAIFSVAFVVYLLTLSPGLSYNSLDGAELATVPYTLGLAHSTGYPLFTWLGKLFTYLPVGDIAYRMNLMSATGAAVGSALLFGVIKLSLRPAALRGSVRPRSTTWLVSGAALFGALMFAFSRTSWSQAVITEVYAPNIAMVSLTFLLLLIWARHEEQRTDRHAFEARSAGLFGLFAVVYGLSIGTHMSDLAFVPAFVIFIVLANWRVLLQPQLVLIGALGFGLGLLQFLWLPYKASVMNDPTFARNVPSTLHGFYNYTLGAFPQMRWAYGLDQLPDRVILYLHLLLENFHLAGVLLGVLGAWVMALRNPKAFFLFVPAYLFELTFFLEYRVGDLDVFFIPSHYIYAVFIAYGGYFLAERTLALVLATGGIEGVKALLARRAWPRLGLLAGATALVVALATLPIASVTQYWHSNDQSANTGINDFYKLAFAQLPPNSTLSGQGGVFGYDVFYWRLVYDLRPDVTIPGSVPGSFQRPGGGAPGQFGRGGSGSTAQAQQNVFTTTGRGGGGALGGFGGGFGGGGFGGRNASWSWPILAAPTVREDGGGATRQLTLYQTRTDAPQLFVQNVTPQHVVNATFNGVTLAGYSVDSDSVVAGGTVHLKLYWQLTSNNGLRDQIATKVGDTPYIETHTLGFGNLQQYIQANGQPASNALLVEDYQLVVLSSLDAGPQHLRVQVGNSAWVDLGTLTVTK